MSFPSPGVEHEVVNPSHATSSKELDMDEWLSPTVRVPARLDLPTGHHLRPIRVEDLAIDYPMVMGCQPRLWQLFGPVWGWPPTDMTIEQDRDDLLRHVDEMSRNESFNYAIFDAQERRLFGCVYIDPPATPVHDAEVCWWVVDDEVAGPLDRCLDTAIPRWLGALARVARSSEGPLQPTLRRSDRRRGRG
jgi:hypothetical protein